MSKAIQLGTIEGSLKKPSDLLEFTDRHRSSFIPGAKMTYPKNDPKAYMSQWHGVDDVDSASFKSPAAGSEYAYEGYPGGIDARVAEAHSYRHVTDPRPGKEPYRFGNKSLDVHTMNPIYELPPDHKRSSHDKSQIPLGERNKNIFDENTGGYVDPGAPTMNGRTPVFIKDVPQNPNKRAMVNEELDHSGYLAESYYIDDAASKQVPGLKVPIGMDPERAKYFSKDIEWTAKTNERVRDWFQNNYPSEGSYNHRLKSVKDHLRKSYADMGIPRSEEQLQEQALQEVPKPRTTPFSREDAQQIIKQLQEGAPLEGWGLDGLKNKFRKNNPDIYEDFRHFQSTQPKEWWDKHNSAIEDWMMNNVAKNDKKPAGLFTGRSTMPS